MRIFGAGIFTETNTFSPLPTGMSAFLEGEYHRGTASSVNSFMGNLSHVFRELSSAAGAPYCESVFAYAEPGGRVVHAAYERLVAEVFEDLGGSSRPDIVLLLLHGAMATTEVDDCEGDFLLRLRQVLGPDVVIGAVLDPHAHLSPAMLDHADVLIASRLYPHTDFSERCRELFHCCMETAAGRVSPVMSQFDCRMLGVFPTSAPSMQSLLTRMGECESRRGVLSVSLIHGFPFGDTEHLGARALAVCDRSWDLASATATELGEAFYDLRGEGGLQLWAVDEALEEALVSPDIIVLADTADNPGGGAPGDSTFLLKAALARGVRQAAFGALYDPVTAQLCADAGPGARLTVRLGGKLGPSSGEPLDLEVQVKAVKHKHDQEALESEREGLGLCVWLSVDGIDIVVSSLRRQVYSPEVFSGLGIALDQVRVFLVKSTNHFVRGFAPLTSRILHVATPGALSLDLKTMRYQTCHRELYPFHPDPLGRG